MRINEFAKKYGVDKRSIDYWTNLDLLHPEIREGNGYRIYGPKAEEEIKIILIAQATGIDGKINKAVEFINHIREKEPEKWDILVAAMIQSNTEWIRYKHIQAMQYAFELYKES